MLFAFLFQFINVSIEKLSQIREILPIEFFLQYDDIELEESNGYRNEFEK